MVKVYIGRECSEYTLEELNSLTVRDLVQKIAKQGADRSVLSLTGRFLPMETPLSSHNIRDTDTLRVLQSHVVPKVKQWYLCTSFERVFFSFTYPQSCDDSMLKECDRLFDYLQKEESGYMHMRLMAEVVEPEFLSKIMKQFPELRNDPVACHVLHDYYIFKAMVTLPSDEEALEKLRKFHCEHPALLPAINWLLRKYAQKGRGSSQSSGTVTEDVKGFDVINKKTLIRK
uniref:Ubiquitin-like domain-containing protein n=1 Tax=Angiostrongylus cantonensis TaxID=6313 RepID=A0A0K0D1Z7_ANGCA